MRKFSDLSEQEVLALAITLEGEDERVYADFTDGLKATYPATAAVFDGMSIPSSRRGLAFWTGRWWPH